MSKNGLNNNQNWLWIAIAVVVIIYLYRKNKTESSFKSSRPSIPNASFPAATWKNPGWFELKGASSGHAWLKRNRSIVYYAPHGAALYDYFTNGNGGTGRWNPYYNMPGADASRRNLSFKFGATTADRIFGYWYYDCNFCCQPIFFVKKIVSYGGSKTFDFSGDTWVNSNCVSPTSLDGGIADANTFPQLMLEGASLVRVG